MNLLDLNKAVKALNKVFKEYNVVLEEIDFEVGVDGFFYDKKISNGNSLLADLIYDSRLVINIRQNKENKNIFIVDAWLKLIMSKGLAFKDISYHINSADIGLWTMDVNYTEPELEPIY